MLAHHINICESVCVNKQGPSVPVHVIVMLARSLLRLDFFLPVPDFSERQKSTVRVEGGREQVSREIQKREEEADLVKSG
jgi:hypothetical protein